MNRRKFLLTSAVTAATLPFSRLHAAQTPTPWNLSSRNHFIIDACGGINTENIPLKSEILQQCLDTGVTAINWTVSDVSLEGTLGNMGFVESLAEVDPAHFLIVRRHADIARAAQSRAIGIIMGFQDPGPIDPSLDRLEMFRRLGVLIMQVTYNNRGLYGDGCLEPGNAGLSKLGRAAIARMNELGIAVDLSHCGQRTTAEGIAASQKPPLITHSGCAVVHAHPRNKEDREIKAMADHGGVMGIYFMPYLVASPISPAREHVLAHLDHALKVAGTDHVGIGSDGSLNTVPDTSESRKQIQEGMERRKKLGIAAPEEDRPPYSPDLNTPARLEIIASGLQSKGYSTEVVEKVLGKNFNRAFGEIWNVPLPQPS